MFGEQQRDAELLKLVERDVPKLAHSSRTLRQQEDNEMMVFKMKLGGSMLAAALW